MLIAFYNGVSGMRAYQEQINVVGHNISNVNTVGYKPSRSSFSDLLYTQMNTNVEGENLVGHGVKHQDTDLMYGESGLDQTLNKLDFAIAGDGFFAVRNSKGETEYTRAGTFAISQEGKTGYLVTSNGDYVLDKTGKQIKIPLMSARKDLTDEEKKALASSNTLDLDALPGLLGVYTFDNPYGLETVDGARFRETATSGTATALKGNTTQDRVRQGMVEFSGVELSNEMVKMIEAQRAFQFNAKVVQTADAMEDTVNNLR